MGILKDKKNDIVSVLESGGVVYMPTDTIPGLICSALDGRAVEKIFELKKRDLNKPPTVVISKLEDLNNIAVTLPELDAVADYWPGNISLVLDVDKDKIQDFVYLHRGLNTLAIRQTAFKDLADIINEVGPLATSSANIQDEEPATTAAEAEHYFGGGVDMYVEPQFVADKPSSMVRIHPDGTREALRD